MSSYFAAGRLSEEEKQDILSQHREIYNGYQTMQPKISNTQPLYVQDFAKDKVGAVVSNKGTVKPYTNVGINESVKEVCDECGAMPMDEEKQVCSECGGMMSEGECSECGWKGEVGAMDEETGHLDDIYKVRDLDLSDGDFDYVEGGGNDYGTFEKAHHMKEDDGDDFVNYEDNFENPDNEDDGFEDLQVDGGEMFEISTDELEKGKKYKYRTPSFDDELEFSSETDDLTPGEKMYHFKGKEFSHLLPKKGIEKFVHHIDEQGYTGGGNGIDSDLSNIEPAYDFKSNGAGDVYPTEGEMDEEYETMESAWSDDEIDETDVSGVQGIYGDMEPAFDFDSEGPGKAGPYQHSSWGGGSSSDDTQGYEGEDEDAYWEKDLEPGELDLDLTKFNPEDKSWAEISDYTGDDEFSHVDEDIRESFINQKNKIMEMMNRMKVIK